jgi:hypothetical protein
MASILNTSRLLSNAWGSSERLEVVTGLKDAKGQSAWDRAKDEATRGTLEKLMDTYHFRIILHM